MNVFENMTTEQLVGTLRLSTTRSRRSLFDAVADRLELQERTIEYLEHQHKETLTFMDGVAEIETLCSEHKTSCLGCPIKEKCAEYGYYRIAQVFHGSIERLAELDHMLKAHRRKKREQAAEEWQKRLAKKTGSGAQ